ncbi:MAG: four-helix bundle copper-binding protein [Gaiellales bacterium]|jgi:hypothetical protein
MSEHATAHRAGERFADCIASCTDCHQVCVESISAGVQQGGQQAHLLHLRLLMDCATVCDTTRDLMLRSSDFAHQMCRLCAAVCERCAVSCERAGGEQMQRCAEACRRCAANCGAMAT